METQQIFILHGYGAGAQEVLSGNLLKCMVLTYFTECLSTCRSGLDLENSGQPVPCPLIEYNGAILFGFYPSSHRLVWNKNNNKKIRFYTF